MTSPHEHDVFSKLTVSLSDAESAARNIAALRRDQRNGWSAVADLLAQVKDKCYKLAMTGVRQ